MCIDPGAMLALAGAVGNCFNYPLVLVLEVGSALSSSESPSDIKMLKCKVYERDRQTRQGGH